MPHEDFANVIYPLSFDGKKSKQHVFLKNIITNPNITVGEYTFYHDRVDPYNFEKYNASYFPPHMPGKLIIGKYCSLADGVQFLSSVVNHHMDGSTFPFAVFWGAEKTGYEYYYPVKKDTVIGNDVWIGCEAMIMPGVTIGDGAIIGARAVVTKDVPPYTIVAGNPAMKIRDRFTPKICQQLLEIKWWDWPNDLVVKNACHIVKNDIEKLLDASKKT